MATSNELIRCQMCAKVALFVDGKTLPCYHWLCGGCVDYFHQGGGSIRCPLCQSRPTFSTTSGSKEDKEVKKQSNKPLTG